ncbi:YjeJ family protein [Klebsiella sp. B345]|uniref:YjeJ family protein n=1 Tax=Klebsiella sp. B345 TaxID=2755398 RepID=UPI003DA9B49E
MQGQFIGFNTSGITLEDRFFALMLKTKQQDQRCQTYYLQVNALTDLLLVLRHRMTVVFQRLMTEGDSYQAELSAFNEQLLANTPPIEASEIQQPNQERRIMSITLKPGTTASTLILVLQNEQIVTLHIDDMQVEALLIGIYQALQSTGDEAVIEYFDTMLDFLLLYTIDLTQSRNFDYQQYTQSEWRLNLFSHYLSVLFCCDTPQGRKIISGAVIKTSVSHHSEEENSIVMRLLEKSPKLKALHGSYEASQIYSQIIPSQPGKMMTMEECLRPLHAFYLETQATIDTQS